MKKLLFLVSAILLLAMSSLFTSCEKDEEVLPDRPTITVPLLVPSVAINSMLELSFGINIPGGFKSATYETLNGTFAFPGTMSIEVGDTSGDITGTFTAGENVGYGQVSLIVVDQNGKSDVGYITVQITE